MTILPDSTGAEDADSGRVQADGTLSSIRRMCLFGIHDIMQCRSSVPTLNSTLSHHSALKEMEAEDAQRCNQGSVNI